MREKCASVTRPDTRRQRCHQDQRQQQEQARRIMATRAWPWKEQPASAASPRELWPPCPQGSKVEDQPDRTTVFNKGQTHESVNRATVPRRRARLMSTSDPKYCMYSWQTPLYRRPDILLSKTPPHAPVRTALPSPPHPLPTMPRSAHFESLCFSL